MATGTTKNSGAPTQAMWGSHLFMLPGNKRKDSSGSWDGQFSYKAECDVQQQETTEAQNPINNTGEDKQKSFSIRIVVNKLADGLDPLAVHKSLCASEGKKSHFYLGSKPIDSSYYFLQDVELHYSNIDIAPDGTPYRADITLSFVEDVIMRKKKGDGTTTTSSGKKSAAKVGASKEAKISAKEVWGDSKITEMKQIVRKE